MYSCSEIKVRDPVTHHTQFRRARELITHFSPIEICCFRRACTIELPDMLIVTGGDLTRTKVSSYTITGWKSDFPDLNIGRSSHGCGFYLNDDMKRVRNELTYYVLTKVNVHILLSEIKTTYSSSS